MKYNVLIVGGGHGGAQLAMSLRLAGFLGSIAIVTEEPEFPYERPPLSKEYFSGEKPVERIRIRPAEFWDERQIGLILNERVVRVSPDRHLVETASGTFLEYGQLVWAAGGAARKLAIPVGLESNVLSIRTLADADRLRALAQKAANVVVVGGGYIGLEAAAVLNKAGKHVTIVEALDRVLARAAGVDLSRFLENEHRAHGVDVRLSATISGYSGKNSVEAVQLDDGSSLPCDLLIAGIGIVPETAPLAAAGAANSNGVEVDEHCRTSLPDIYAIGDCAAHRSAYAECARIRLESVQNATDMAKIVAGCLTGKPETYMAVPWFWSNQYDLKIQTIGLSLGHDEAVVRGDPASRSFSIVYLRQGRVIALDCVNSTRDYVQGKALVMAGARLGRTDLADTAMPLKELLAGSGTKSA